MEAFGLHESLGTEALNRESSLWEMPSCHGTGFRYSFHCQTQALLTWYLTLTNTHKQGTSRPNQLALLNGIRNLQPQLANQNYCSARELKAETGKIILARIRTRTYRTIQYSSARHNPKQYCNADDCFSAPQRL